MDLFQFVSLGWLVALVLFFIWLSNSLYILKEWERGAVLRLGRMIPDAKGAGLRLVPMIAGVLIMSIVSGQVITRTGRYRAFPIAGTLPPSRAAAR